MLPKSSKNFVVKFPKTPTRSETIIVSKAVAKRAVDRNRIKRITKEALGKLGNHQAGLVLIVKNNVASLKSQDIYDELKKII